ncbi:MAG: 5'-methylthioadenosine/adenosylhomocysteine nucleosidase [candidate division Zixibacteria bacterium]
MIGIIGAMPEEISLFKENIEVADSYTFAKMDYFTGTLYGQEIVLLQSGVGKVNATIGTQILIDKFKIEQIIFTGLTGALVPHLSRGDIVVSNFVVQYDLDLTAFGRRHGELPDIGRMIEADPGLVKLACYAFDDNFINLEGSPKLVVGTIVSGDRFVSSRKKIDWLQREFGAVATEMEGAAVGHACYLNEIPFVIIRTISDSAGSDAKDEFEGYLEYASKNSFKIVSIILEAISHKESVN